MGLVLEKFFELLNCQTGVANNRCHRVGVDGIIARYDDADRPFGHENMLALAIDLKSGSPAL